MIKILIPVIVMFLITSSNSDVGPDSEEFPVPNAEEELKPLKPILRGFAEMQTGKIDGYLLLASPHGPLDLEVNNASTYKDASFLKNYYLGISGRILGFNPLNIANAFHCGTECTTKRISSILLELDSIQSIALEFQKTDNLKLLATWSQNSAYRINSLFFLADLAREAMPSDKLKFIPSGKWIEYRSPAEYCEKNDINFEKSIKMIAKMNSINARSIRMLDNGSVEICFGGIGDNSFGVIINNTNAKPPSIDDTLVSGYKYTIIKKIAANAFYYETT